VSVTINPSAQISVSVFAAGNICVGHVMSRAPRGFEAFDRDDKSVGLFPTLNEAANELEQLAVSS
jgi:hypothetical protein